MGPGKWMPIAIKLASPNAKLKVRVVRKKEKASAWTWEEVVSSFQTQKQAGFLTIQSTKNLPILAIIRGLDVLQNKDCFGRPKSQSLERCVSIIYFKHLIHQQIGESFNIGTHELILASDLRGPHNVDDGIGCDKDGSLPLNYSPSEQELMIGRSKPGECRSSVIAPDEYLMVGQSTPLIPYYDPPEVWSRQFSSFHLRNFIVSEAK
ncbi:hypothetical protein ACLOJK_013605 [Asimina triloba]